MREKTKGIPPSATLFCNNNIESRSAQRPVVIDSPTTLTRTAPTSRAAASVDPAQKEAVGQIGGICCFISIVTEVEQLCERIECPTMGGVDEAAFIDALIASERVRAWLDVMSARDADPKR